MSGHMMLFPSQAKASLSFSEKTAYILPGRSATKLHKLSKNLWTESSGQGQPVSNSLYKSEKKSGG
ncbi:MAG: hypothetical protein QXO22_06470 [Thermosphaera sp.]